MSITTYSNSSLPDGETVFYREAGKASNPTVLLLHGFPTSSHQFRNLIPILAQKYHVLAPDLPGFGFTTLPEGYVYTFDNLASTISSWLSSLPNSPSKYAIYIFDYGAPVGLRLALKHPSAITAIITQNGNAYEGGLTDAWGPIRKYWSTGTKEDREAIRFLLQAGTTKWQYETGASDPKTIDPATYMLDQALMDRPGNDEIQLDLFYDYRNNVAKYPQFHEYFRKSQVPLLATWGSQDPFFVNPSLFKDDLPKAEVHDLKAGHFALESNLEEISKLIMDFLGRNI
jgi:pimeloyl-ACP methyl ester carboxylesterase